MEKHGIILFDGVCNLCNGFVQRVIATDKKDFFRFASLQSEVAQKLLKRHPDLQELKSIVYLEEDKIFSKSNAALKISLRLGGVWSLLKLGYVLPNFLRDGIYNVVAKNRYRWFGKKDQCMVPTPEMMKKFL